MITKLEIIENWEIAKETNKPCKIHPMDDHTRGLILQFETYLRSLKDIYECSMCGYKSDIEHFKEWKGMCYQCFLGETEFKNEGMV